MISRSRTWSIAFHLHPRIDKIAHMVEQPANTYKSCLPRESPLNHSWPWWIPPQVIRDIHISPRLSCLWFLAEGDYCSKSIDISTCIHRHPGMPGYKKHNRMRMSSILHPTDFAFISLLQRIDSCLARARQQKIIIAPRIVSLGCQCTNLLSLFIWW